MPSYPNDAVNVVADRICDLDHNLPYDEAEEIARDLVIDVTIMVDKLRKVEAEQAAPVTGTGSPQEGA